MDILLFHSCLPSWKSSTPTHVGEKNKFLAKILVLYDYLEQSKLPAERL